ncbi:MAG TPA: type II secretion system F family protein [Pseudobacteroides sp.]|uniref:type II secretion system F family protein n=1 Tax=Pseudobacteroides sp. TaxID=1968840 RepID=UPI002F9301AC
MPLYTYRVKNESGKIFTGEAKVERESDLSAMLIERGYSVVEIKEKNAFTDISQIKIFQKRVTIKDLSIFSRQFAIILEAGIPIAACLDILKEQTTNPTLKRVITDIGDDIKKGISLSASMKKQTDIFPGLFVTMVEAGEVSGQLDKVFNRLAEQMEKQYKLNQKIKSAMTYPIIVVSIAVIVVIILMAFVVPSFTSALGDFGVEMPIFTKILIAVSGFFKMFWWAVFLAIGGTVFFLRSYSKTKNGKRFFGSLAIRLPVIKIVVKNTITARFTRTLGTLIASGVMLIQSMEVVQNVIGNAAISEAFDEVISEIKKGRGLSQPLASMKFFPPMVMSMIKVGEESGDLDFSLNKCADFYDEEVEVSLKMMTDFINPAIIMVLAVLVGFIVLSVLYPMLSIYQNIE